MPLYEYKCLGCGHQFELLIMKASPAHRVPVLRQRICGAAALDVCGQLGRFTAGEHRGSLQIQQQAEREAGAGQAESSDRTQAPALIMIRTLAVIAALAQIVLQTVAAQPAFSFRVVTSGLSAPWEVLVGPDDHLWVTERTGRRVIRVNPATGAVTPALTVDESYDPGESWHEGVLGLALHPDLLKGAGRDYVYVAYTYDADAGPALSRRLKVRRYTYDTAKSTLTTPLDSDHESSGARRSRRRPAAFRARSEAVSDARRQRRQLARELLHAEHFAGPADRGACRRTRLVHLRRQDSAAQARRLDSSRQPVAQRRPQPHLYVRPSQSAGPGFGPTGLLYSSEHGPGTDDELNLIVAGSNYGWPHVAGYRDDRGYIYSNWSQSKGVACASLKFDEFGDVPPSVPRQRESEWKGTFVPPMRTFFTVPADYDFRNPAVRRSPQADSRSTPREPTASQAGRTRSCRPA